MRILITSILAVLVGSTSALAQSGHFITSGNKAPQCFDIGTQLSCTGKVAGLGGTIFEIKVEAPALAIVECENPADKDHRPPGQDTEVTATGTTGPLPTPRNGQYTFLVTTDEPDVPNTPTCPNPQWTAHVVDVEFGDATLSLFEDGKFVEEVTVPVQ